MKLTTGYKKPIDSDGNVLLAGGGHKTIQLIINDYGSLSITPAVTFNLAINADILGNSTTTDRLKTARTISLTGNVTGSATWDASGNLSISTTVSGGSATDSTKVAKAGDTMSGALTTATATSGTNLLGIKFGTTTLSSLSDYPIFFDCPGIRFTDGHAWDWNKWAGLKYDSANKYIYLGLAASPFQTNSNLSGGKLLLPGISEVRLGSATDANLVYHTGNKPTKSDVGLGNVDNTADANKSVNYANSAGSSGSCTGNSATANRLTTYSFNSHNTNLYRLIGLLVVSGGWNNKAIVLSISSRHSGIGIYTIHYGSECSAGYYIDRDASATNDSYYNNSRYCSIRYFGNSEDLSNNKIVCYFKPAAGDKPRSGTFSFFLHSNDGSNPNISILSSWGTPFALNANTDTYLMSSVDEATYGTVLANTLLNVADSCTGNSATATGLLSAIANDKLPTRLQEYRTTGVTDENLTVSGFHYMNASASPFVGTEWTSRNDHMLTVNAYSTNWASQIALNFYAPELFVRNKNNGTWSNWAGILISKYTLTGNMKESTYNRGFKKCGGNAAWDSLVYSRDGYANGCFVSFKAGSTGNAIMVGLNSDPATDSNYASIDYCWYLLNNADKTLLIYESGNAINSISGHTNYNSGDDLKIEYSNGLIRYYHNGILCRTVKRSIFGKLYMDSSFHGNASYIYDVEFGPSVQTLGFGLYERSLIPSNFDLDDNLHSGFFEIRPTSECPNWTGTRPVNGYGSILNLRSEYVMMQISAFNNSEFYIRGILRGTGNLSGLSWKKIALSGESQPANGGNSSTVGGVGLSGLVRAECNQPYTTPNDIAKNMGGFMGMITGTGTAGYPNNDGGWTHIINIPYNNIPNGSGNTSNFWCTLLANKAGSTNLYIRSRAGGNDITTGWTLWERLSKVTETVNISESQTITGAKTFSLAINADILGNATTADRLKNDVNGGTNYGGWADCKILNGVIKYYDRSTPYATSNSDTSSNDGGVAETNGIIKYHAGSTGTGAWRQCKIYLGYVYYYDRANPTKDSWNYDDVYLKLNARAASATDLYVREHSSNNIVYYPMWANGTGDNVRNIYITKDKLQFVPGTGKLTATGGFVSGGTSTLSIAEIDSLTAGNLVVSGSSSLGTVTSGIWNGTTIANGYIATALTGKTYNGYTLADACAKGVLDKTSNYTVTSTGTNLVTERAIYYILALKGYTTNTGTVTLVKVGNTAYNPSSGIVSLPAYPTTLPANGGTATVASLGAPAALYPNFAFFTNWTNANRMVGLIYANTGANGSWGSGGSNMFFRTWYGASGTTNDKNKYMDCYLPSFNSTTENKTGYICVTNVGTISGSLTLSGSYYANSDIRHKNIIKNISPRLEDLANIPIFEYEWKNKLGIHLGTSALAVEKILPKLITEDNTGFKSLDYATLGMITGVIACKEIELLKKRIKELEDKLNG